VERAQGTHCYELYEASDLPWRLEELSPLLWQWEYVYNHIRQAGHADSALGGETPAGHLDQSQFPLLHWLRFPGH
jgi:hypothetical protein